MPVVDLSWTLAYAALIISNHMVSTFSWKYSKSADWPRRRESVLAVLRQVVLFLQSHLHRRRHSGARSGVDEPELVQHGSLRRCSQLEACVRALRRGVGGVRGAGQHGRGGAVLEVHRLAAPGLAAAAAAGGGGDGRGQLLPAQTCGDCPPKTAPIHPPRHRNGPYWLCNTRHKRENHFKIHTCLQILIFAYFCVCYWRLQSSEITEASCSRSIPHLSRITPTSLDISCDSLPFITYTQLPISLVLNIFSHKYNLKKVSPKHFK